MKKLFSILLLTIAVAVYAQTNNWTGFISDSDCGAKGNKADHAACAAKCIKGGASPVLVVGDKVYKVDSVQVAPYVGKKVTVNGKLEGETVKIDKIQEAK